MPKGSVRDAGEFLRFSKLFLRASNDFLRASNDFFRAISLEDAEFFRSGGASRVPDDLRGALVELELPKGLLLVEVPNGLDAGVSSKGLLAVLDGDVVSPKRLLLSSLGPNDESKGLSDGLFFFSPNGLYSAILSRPVAGARKVPATKTRQ